jgi:thymidylate kinase
VELAQQDNMQGKLIVLYGANNLGKSTQVELLEKSLQEKGLSAKRIKYPIYDLEPTGPLINSVLREGKSMDEEELQNTFAQNKRDYEPQLKELLNSGTHVIAEDYTGTGIAWGMVRGVDIETLEKMNVGIYVPDIAIMLTGQRFESGRESTHRNETNDTIWQTAKEKHDFLAERYSWHTVNANQSVEDVQTDIIKILEQQQIISVE